MLDPCANLNYLVQESAVRPACVFDKIKTGTMRIMGFTSGVQPTRNEVRLLVCAPNYVIR